jgi:PAS domain S-box-containing protein
MAERSGELGWTKRSTVFSPDLASLLLLGIGLIITLSAFLITAAYQDRAKALDWKEASERQNARVLAGHMDSLVIMADHALSEVIDEISNHPGETLAQIAPPHRVLIDGHIIKQIFIFDADGKGWAASPLANLRRAADCSKCQAFRDLQDGGEDTIFGSLFADVPGAATPLGFGRRIDKPDGGFGGMVVAVIDLPAVLRDYGWSGVTIAVITPERGIIAKYSANGPGGRETAHPPEFPDLPAFTTTDQDSFSTLTDRTVASVQRLQYYPAWVGVAEGLDELRSMSRKNFLAAFAFIGGATLAVIVFSLAAGVQISHRRQAEQSLAEARDELEHRVEERTAELQREIQDRAAVEAALRATELRFQRFMENTPTGVYIADDAGRFLYVNRRFADWLGVAASQAVGKTASDLLPEELVWLWEEHNLAVLEEDQPIPRELVFHVDDQERVWLADKFPLTVEPGTNLLGGVVTDISAHRAAERELHHAHRMEALGQLASGVAHDLNNLLTVMLGNLEIVEDLAAGVSEDIQGHAREAEWAARRGAYLTDRLLAMSRRRAPVAELADLNVVVASMSELLRRTLGKEIDTTITPAAVPAMARVDINRLENAILNLCLNARDAMPGGGRLAIAVDAGTVVLPLTAQLPAAGFVSVSVTDSGVGMAPATIAHACDPFFTTKGHGKGTGLGLSMVKGFMTESGGYLSIESEVGIGTRVTLHFSCADAGAPPPGAEDDQAEADLLAPLTVLVVEDEVEVRHIAVDALTRLGCMVYEAEDGPAGLAAVEEHADIDFVFSDISMPGGMTGVDLAREVTARRPQVAILLTSGFPADGETAGEFPVLLKPYDRQALYHAMIRQQRSAQPSHDTDTAAAKV